MTIVVDLNPCYDLFPKKGHYDMHFFPLWSDLNSKESKYEFTSLPEKARKGHRIALMC